MKCSIRLFEKLDFTTKSRQNVAQCQTSKYYRLAHGVIRSMKTLRGLSGDHVSFPQIGAVELVDESREQKQSLTVKIYFSER